jgi:uncharacterized protein (TIGR02266 family)
VLAAGSVGASLRERTERLGHAVAGSDLAPPDHLLFLANELLRPGVKDLRASERVLFGAICAFRPAGAMEPVHGLSYNLSREGLYVRTLDPPSRGTSLWLEMRPPHSRDAVHLRGTVAWSKGLDRPGGVVPPGFGIRLEQDRCPSADLCAYRDGYDALRESRILANSFDRAS